MTKIEWATKTWNPMHGCTKCSSGCDNCYAERMANRQKHMGTKGYENGFAVTLREDRLDHPLRNNRPTIYFVCSMGDLFHKDVPLDFIDNVYAIAALCPHHAFLILTKRAERMAEYFQGGSNSPYDTREVLIHDALAFSVEGLNAWDHATKLGGRWYPPQVSDDWIEAAGYWDGAEFDWPLPNIYHGVTVCNQAEADEKIPHLLNVPGKRFLSIEPMLGPINLTHLDADSKGHQEFCQINCLTGRHTDMGRPCKDVPVVHQVIVGGESGPKARPMNPQWVRDIRDQCEHANVPFMFKQWGEWVDEFHPAYHSSKPTSEAFVKHIEGQSDYRGHYMGRVGKKNAGRELDGKIHDELIWSK